MKTLLLILFFFLLSGCAGFVYAADYGPYSAKVVRVIDGDTVVMDLAIMPDVIWRVKIRIAGVDTPEIEPRYPKCQIPAGLAAKAYTENWFKGATDIQVSGVHLGSFVHRAVGNIIAIKSGTQHNLGDDLLASKHARVEIIGQTGKGWCT